MHRFNLLTCLLLAFLFFTCPVHAYLPSDQNQHPLSKKNEISPYATVIKNIETDSFCKVQAYGRVNIEIVAGQRTQDIQVTGNSLALSTLQIKAAEGVLHIFRKTTTKKPGRDKCIALYSPVTLRIFMPELRAFHELGVGTTNVVNVCGPLSIEINGRVSARFCGENIDLRNLQIGGATSITVSQLNSRCLRIFHSGIGKICLEGIAALRSVYQDGDGELLLPWIESPHFLIIARDNSKICVAGKTHTYVAIMNGDSYLNANGLCAFRAYVNTNDYATAEIWGAIDTLTLWASRCSNLYYHNKPAFVSNNVSPPGSVISLYHVCEDYCCSPCYKVYK